MKNTILLITCILISVTANSQTIINGVIKNIQGEPVENVYITITQHKSPVILAYASSDKSGYYTVSYKGNADTICINVSRLDFKKETNCIINKSQKIDFTLQPEITQLNEVVVKPANVWHDRDTVNFSVREFTQKSDRSIADVLKRMPGIEVSQSGKISYNGEPINKFYVENMDLMGGQYNVISNNLNNKHVEKVQVYENHEPIKTMQDKSMSDQAAINLVLKDNAKAKWLASGKFGIGLEPLLWDNELSLMRFSKKTQSTFIYKNNNAGNNISNDLTAHYGLISKMSKADLIGIPTSTPPISQTNRYLFNNAHLFTVNNLWNLNSDYQLKLNADYLNDYQKRENKNKTVHYLNNEGIVIEEKSNTAININKLKASLTLTGNHKKYYLLNTLSAQVDWSNERANINGNNQYLENPYHNVSNNFAWIKTFGKNKIEINSENRFEKMPQTLDMQPGLYEDVFNNGNPYQLLRQDTDYTNFKSDNYINYTYSKGRISQNYAIGFNALWQSIESELGVQGKTNDNDFKNNFNYNENQYYLKARFDYTGKKIRGSLTLPMGYQTINSNDKTRAIKHSHNRVYFNPVLNIWYTVNISWNVLFAASYIDKYTDIKNLYRGYMLSNYRSIMKNDGEFSKSEMQNYILTLSYNNPVKYTNIYISGRYMRTHLDYLFEQGFDGILSVRKKVDFANNIESKSLSATVSKGFDRLIKKMLLQASYSINTSNQLQAGKPAKYKRNMLTAAFTIEAAPAKWINAFYIFNLSSSTSNLSGNNVNIGNGSINRFDHRLKLGIFPAKNWQIGLNAEYEHASAQSNLPDIFFADINLSYKLKKAEFTLSWNNIFNQKEYTISSYGDFHFTHNTYKLRPANVLLTVRLLL